MARVLVLVGTKKGAFLLESDDRESWRRRGPVRPDWPFSHVTYDPASGAILAGGGNAWYGPAVWRSLDLGETWSHSSEGLTYGDGGPAVTTIWNLTPGHGIVYAGVEPAGLFRSDDGGVSWSHVSGLREHPSCPQWEPGNGGLCLHSIVPHATDPDQLWVGISAVGTFQTTDGGKTWETRNRGVRAEFMPERYPEFGQCVHKLLAASGSSNLLYQQNHCGVYRSADGGREWEEITSNLPSDFGFPLGLHPRDPQTAWVIPLDGMGGRIPAEGKPAVYRTRDGGASWERHATGLPAEGYFGVLREGMAVDSLDRAGVYFGTSTGQVFASNDEGETWSEIAANLPSVLSVEAVVIER